MLNKIVIEDDSVLLYQNHIGDDNWEKVLAFPKGGLTYLVSNGTIKFFAYQDYFYRNCLMSMPIPIYVVDEKYDIDGEYDDVDEIGSILNDIFPNNDIDDDLSLYLLKAEAAQTYQPIGDYLTEDDLDDYYTKDEVDDEFADMFRDLTGHTTDDGIHVTPQDKDNWDAKVDPSAITGFFDGVVYDSQNTNILFKHGNDTVGVLPAAPFIKDGMVDSVQISGNNLVITFNIDAGKQDIVLPLPSIFDPDDYYTKADVDGLLADKADASDIPSEYVTDVGAVFSDSTQKHTLLYIRKNNGGKDIKFPSINGKYIAGQTQDFSLVETSDFNTYSASVATQLNGKQPTLISGSNIKTINGLSILGSGDLTIGGGGSTYTAGRGIRIQNDEISLSLPISASTGIGSIAEGISTTANGMYSHAAGFMTETTNSYEFATGNNNISHHESNNFGESGNTLFSVGNGQTANSKHNAFEIRQNGDIYITSGGTDIKLQDHLGGGGGDLTNYYTKTEADNKFALKTDIPSNVSYFINDAGYVTNSYIANNYISRTYFNEVVANLQQQITNLTEALGECCSLTGETIYKWETIPNQYNCVGYDKYTVLKKMQSTDGGATWTDVTPLETKNGTLIESDSQYCGYQPAVNASGSAVYQASSVGQLIDIGSTEIAILRKPDGTLFYPNAQNNDVTTMPNAGRNQCEIKLVDGITYLGNAANYFSSSYVLEYSFNGGFTKIAQGCFKECTIMTALTLPSTVTEIRYQAFENCNALQSLTILATTPPTLIDGGYYGNSIGQLLDSNPNVTIYVPSASLSAYRNATTWSNYASRIEAIN